MSAQGRFTLMEAVKVVVQDDRYGAVWRDGIVVGRTLEQNARTAQEVYDIIKLQYDEGIKAYVDLVVAETDLKTAQLNYFNALFRVLSSKLDVEQALGTVPVQ